MKTSLPRDIPHYSTRFMASSCRPFCFPKKLQPMSQKAFISNPLFYPLLSQFWMANSERSLYRFNRTPSHTKKARQNSFFQRVSFYPCLTTNWTEDQHTPVSNFILQKNVKKRFFFFCPNFWYAFFQLFFTEWSKNSGLKNGEVRVAFFAPSTCVVVFFFSPCANSENVSTERLLAG